MTVHSVGLIHFPPGLFSNERYCIGSVSNLSNYDYIIITIDYYSEKTRFYLNVDALPDTSLTLQFVNDGYSMICNCFMPSESKYPALCDTL